ncbi:hypothetical protein HKX48_003774 [Thoreauomyces humboldtii]|nr:hypothetical protein HKX48_003774 [Thoreauomyces humboldtii]
MLLLRASVRRCLPSVSMVSTGRPTFLRSLADGPSSGKSANLASTPSPASSASSPSSGDTVSSPARKSNPLTDVFSKPTPSKTNLSSLLANLYSKKPTSDANYLGSFAPQDQRKQRENSKNMPAGRANADALAMGSDREPDHYVLHILANKNNTMATLTNEQGKILVQASAGQLKLRKAARGTSDAGYQTVAYLTEKVLALPFEKQGNEKPKQYHEKDLKQIVTQDGIHMRFKGFGPGRDQAFRAVMAAGWKVNRLIDNTPVAHAGCRPRKRRRL